MMPRSSLRRRRFEPEVGPHGNLALKSLVGESGDIAPTIKDAIDHDEIILAVKRDRDAALKADEQEAGTDIVATRAAIRVRHEAETLRLDAFDEAEHDSRSRAIRDIIIEAQ